MNPSIKKLGEIGNKKTRKIIGLMSGTSLDGLDIALCLVTGSGPETKVETEQFVTTPYSDSQKSRLKKISSVENISLAELCFQHTWLAAVHAGMILDALSGWGIKPVEIDCIASHGQTVYHFPARDQKQPDKKLNATLQIADGDQIAVRTGILTISDFRQKHTAAGGEGAPMAALVDRLLFRRENQPAVLLNIGGIANYTWLPDKNSKEESFTTDCGPGNTLIDNVVQKYYQKPFDKDGKIAASGTVHQTLLNTLTADSWFDEKETKSTGPEYFNISWLTAKADLAGVRLAEIDPSGLVATVTELSAVTIANSIQRNVPDASQCTLYTSGGGAHNPVLTGRILELLAGAEVRNISELGVDPDAKEAVIFAVLANEMLAGSGFRLKTEKGDNRNLQFGKISFPC